MGTWQHWLNALLGLWVLAIPFLFGITGTGLIWTLVISGLVIAVLAFWGAGETQGNRSTRRFAESR